jgi:hypothetical protein
MKLLAIVWKVIVGVFIFFIEMMLSADDEDNKPKKNEYTGSNEYKGQGHYEYVHRDQYGQRIEDD